MDLNSSVFITGIDGFTGRYLESHLQNLGYIVSGSSLKPQKTNHLFMDLSSKKSINEAFNKIKCDYFIHLAAISFAMDDEKKIEQVNKDGTLNLLEALFKLHPKRVIFASSASVYGGYDKPIGEEFKTNPTNIYAKSKLFMEEQILKSSLNYIITRPFNYTGVGQTDKFLVPKIVNHFKNKLSIIKLGNLTPKREYNNVLDVVRIYENLLNDKIPNKEIFNIGSGVTYSILEMVKMLERITGFSIKIEVDEKFIRKDDPEIISCDTKKICKFGIRPCKADLEKNLYSQVKSHY